MNALTASVSTANTSASQWIVAAAAVDSWKRTKRVERGMIISPFASADSQRPNPRSSYIQMNCDFGLQFVNEFLLHESVFVGYPQHNDPLAIKSRTKSLAQLREV